MATIFVFAEINEGVVNDVSLQVLAAARRIAVPGDRVVAFAAGSGITAVVQTLCAHGADEAVVADDAAFKDYLTSPYRAAVSAFLAQHPCSLVLFPATTCGNDLAPVVAAGLDAACVLDGVALRLEAGKAIVSRIEFDRKVKTCYVAAGDRPMVATLKDGIAEAIAPDAARPNVVKPFAVSLPATRARIVRRDVARKSVNLKAAKIIVGAGAGIGAKDNFAKIQELAGALGAQIGATRAIVDAGWLPADHQIGQTGVTVRPEVYIACGVSGAVQHWVGISEARKIVAINSDKNAPIMKRAHYRIAGDLNAVVPKLTKLLKG